MRTRLVEKLLTQSLLGYLREFVNGPKKRDGAAGHSQKNPAWQTDNERFEARSDAAQRNKLRIRFDMLYWI